MLILSPWLLGERPTKGELLAIPIFGLGLGLFFLDELSPGQNLGNLAALVSGVAFALSIIGLRLLRERGPAALAWGNVLAAAVTLPLWSRGPAATRSTSASSSTSGCSSSASPTSASRAA